jgi:hypothetical protein
MDIQHLVNKAITDPAFARALSENPEQTLRDAGVEPTPEMVDALKGLDPAQLQKLATAFGGDQAAA